MKIITTAFIAIFGVLFSVYTFADTKIDTLLDSNTSWDGSHFSYPQGSPKIIIKKIVIDANKGFKKFHCHITPLAAYIAKGSVEVIKKSGKTRLFKAGEAFTEVTNQWHAGKFSKGTELIVFFASNEKHPLNIYAEDPQAVLCK
jgi:quercetin dioxygenase-like cupin family protein